MRIGVLGTGDISVSFMESATSLDLNVVAVMQRNLEKAKAFQEKYQLAYAFDQLDDLLEVVDLVYVGLPNGLHYEVAKKCLEHNKHVFLEKPVTTYKKEFEELLKIADAHNVYVLEVDRIEFTKAYQIIKSYMDRKIDFFQLDFYKRSRRYDDYLNGDLPNVFNREMTGGAMYDLGVYCLHFLVGLKGMPKNLHYTFEKGRGGVDMKGILALEYEDCLASMVVGKVSHGISQVLIHGDQIQILSHSAPTILKGLQVMEANDTKQYETEENAFTAFVKNAMEIITQIDETRYKAQSEKSLMVMELLDKILVDYIDAK